MRFIESNPEVCLGGLEASSRTLSSLLFSTFKNNLTI